MAIVFDAKSEGTATASTTLTFSHTAGVISKGIIVVTVRHRYTGGGVNTDPTSVTYNAVAMTKVNSDINSDGRASLWILVAPSSGANNVVVTVDASSALYAVASTWSGVDQVSPYSANVVAKPAASTSASTNISSAADEVVVDFLSSQTQPTYTVGASQTEIHQGTASTTVSGVGSYETGAGTTTMSHTMSISSIRMIHNLISLSPAAVTFVPKMMSS